MRTVPYLHLFNAWFAEADKLSDKEVVMQHIIASKGEVDEVRVPAAGLSHRAAAMFLGDYHECRLW